MDSYAAALLKRASFHYARLGKGVVVWRVVSGTADIVKVNTTGITVICVRWSSCEETRCGSKCVSLLGRVASTQHSVVVQCKGTCGKVCRLVNNVRVMCV